MKAAGRGTCVAHIEHVVHVCDAGRVEAQRLVERRRSLPSGKGSIGKRGNMQTGRRRGVAAAQAACREDPTVEACWQDTRGAPETS